MKVPIALHPHQNLLFVVFTQSAFLTATYKTFSIGLKVTFYRSVAQLILFKEEGGVLSFFVDEGEIHLAASIAQLLGWRDECTVLKNLLEKFCSS